ncbi:MAG: FRG domain-containing protein [Mariniphaga sp.]|nr:FRG domain-containing protein [Mariniphaga sp.]
MGLSIIYLNPESWSGTVLNRKVVPFFTGAEKIAEKCSFHAENAILYRGSSNLLVPSIVEKCSFHSYADLVVKEHLLLNDFNKYSHIKHEFKEKVAQDWEIRIAAREHGLASSLMDWSNSLDIALEFAIFQFEKKNIDFTNLWILNKSKLNQITVCSVLEKKNSFQEISSPSIIGFAKYCESTYWRRKFIQGGYFLFQSPQEIIIPLEKNPFFSERLMHIIIPKKVVPEVWKNIASKVNLDLDACPNFSFSDKGLDEKCIELNKIYN